MKKKYLISFPMIAFFLPFIIYIYTLNPKIGFIDAGELITVCKTLGVAHPTGYPLFTILGRVFSTLSIGSVAFRVNIISAIFSSLASLFLFLYLFKKTNKPLLSFSTSLIFAFSRIVWHQSTSAEVYSITFFFLTLLLFLHSSQIKNRLILISFVSGLSLTNHMIIITFLIPFFIYLLVRKEIKNIKGFLLFAIFLILGASLYLYLPIRGNLYPILNWGRPVNLERFLWHVTGKQYRVWMFTGNLIVIKANLINFLKLILFQYTPFIIPLALVGIFYLFTISKTNALFLIILLLVNLIYAINYEIPDIEPYFIISILIYTIFICFGFLFLTKKLKWIGNLSPILPLLVLLFNFHTASERGNYIAYDMCNNLFSSVKENGIVITNLWDYYSPALYLKQIEGVRKDIVMIDKELLRRSWYFDYLQKEYPWLIEHSRKEVESYLKLLDDFEHARLKRPEEIQRRFIIMINSFIERNKEKRPCYITFINGADRDAPFIAQDYMKIPTGITYEISKLPDTTYFDYSTLTLRGIFEKRPYKDERTLHNLKVYPEMSFKRGIYLLQMGRFRSSIKTFEFAARWDETKAASLSYQGAAYLFLDQYDTALSSLRKAQKQKPDDKMLMQAIMMIETGNTDKLKQEFKKLLGIRTSLDNFPLTSTKK